MEREDTDLKKIITAASLVIVFAFCIISVSAFDDMPNDWSTAALQSAVDNGLLKGADNKLNPQNSLTRAEMATILVRALGATETADISQFIDVPQNAWYYSAMATAYKMGIFKGDGAGKMNPDAFITRQEAFVVLARAFNLRASTTSGLTKFSDNDKVAAWARPEIEALVVNGYVGGSGGMLNPLSSITRAEFSQVMYNLNKAYVDDLADLSSLGSVQGNVIIRTSEINTIQDVTINGDLIIGDGMSKDIVFKNVNVIGRLVIRTTGNVKFDGNAKELVLAFDNTTVTASSTSTINRITKDSSFTNAFVKTETDSGIGTGTGPIIGPGTTTPPQKEEDIWTDFH